MPTTNVKPTATEIGASKASPVNTATLTPTANIIFAKKIEEEPKKSNIFRLLGIYYLLKIT
ncbi:hypothetical protein [Rahnella ecdela]|uniref:Uncharacterized protein n=1 Tax=Rahnella ecdela TaxID=2816250 RepID=A0ABS6LFZ3_9GAMM|nr:hypothetical protein [Rahnella ecdela]MBU9845859.1 hypothetical protein [Rahnella ecdela]